MKKLFICMLAVAALTSCDKSKDSVNSSTESSAESSMKAGEIDYQFLSKPEEVKKWYDEIVNKAGSNAKVMDEVSFMISRPSSEGMIKREGEKDYLHLTIVYQDTADKRKVQEITFRGASGGWTQPETKDIQVFGPGSEDFSLEEELFDFNQVTLQTFNKVMADALKTFKDDAKYEYQYISNVTINNEGFDVTVKGKLKSNAQIKNETYRTDLQGNPE